MYDDTWVVVPLHNEAPVIAGVISDLRAVFPHVLVVDDASSDGSGRLAAEAGAHVLTHPVNLGQGGALQTGFDWVLSRTDARWVVTFDADGQHLVSDAARMVDEAVEGDLGHVFGSRFLGAEAVGLSRARRLVLRTAALVTRLRTGLALTDAHNGLRVISRESLAHVHLDKARMAHASQIVAQLAATGRRWAESPVTITYSAYSCSKGQSLLNAVNIAVELLLG